MRQYLPKLLYLTLTILISSCSAHFKNIHRITEQHQLTIHPAPLEVHGNEVVFTLSAQLPKKMMKKDIKYSLDVAFVSGDNEEFIPEQNSAQATPIGTIEFDGSLYENAMQAPVITKKMAFKYQKQHKRGYLVVYGKITKGEVSKKFAPQKLHTKGQPIVGVATTSRLIRNPLDGVSNAQGQSPFAQAITHWKIDDPLVKEYNIRFSQGSDQILANIGSNGQTLKLAYKTFQTIATQFVDPANVPQLKARGVSSHSPEGRIMINQDLPKYRSLALQKQLQYWFNLLSYSNRTGLLNFEFDHKILEATLPKLKSLVQKSTLNQDQKNEVVGIIDNGSAFAEKEKQLQGLSYYPTLIEQVYPQLRYSKIALSTPNTLRTKVYLENLLDKISQEQLAPTQVSEDEYLFMVSVNPNYITKAKWLEKATKAYGTWRLYNNLGATYLDLALLLKDPQYINKAIQVLEKALQQKVSGEIYYNLGMAYLMKEENKKALKYFEKAIKIGGSNNPRLHGLLNGVQGYYMIQTAKSRHDSAYQKTYQLLEKAASSVPNYFNKGLAYLLEGMDYDKAQNAFEAAININPKDEKSLYALAIVAARRGQEKPMISYLQKAVTINPTLKGQAWQDAEFYKFKNQVTFINALK